MFRQPDFREAAETASSPSVWSGGPVPSLAPPERRPIPGECPWCLRGSGIALLLLVSILFFTDRLTAGGGTQWESAMTADRIDNPRSAWARRILALHLPHFEADLVRRDTALAASTGASVERAGNLDARPLVLTRRVGSSVLVHQVCPRAVNRGLAAGMTLGHARACVPDLLAVEHEPDHAAAMLARIGRWCQRFSPLVQLVAPRTLLLDVSGCGPLFGTEDNLLAQIAGGLLRRGLRVSAGLADTIGAAWAVAHCSTSPLTVVPPGASCVALAPLPPEALRIAEPISRQLADLGVRTIGDLFVLPRASLLTRFGPDTVLRLQQALGEVIEPVVAAELADTPCVQLAFEDPVQDRRVVGSMAGHLLDELFTELDRRECALLQLDVLVSFANADPVLLPIRLARALRQQSHIARLLEERIDGLDLCRRSASRAGPGHEPDCDLPDGVLGLRLLARETSPWNNQQGRLFDETDLREQESIGMLIDQVANRLGPDAITRPILLNEHLPECSVRYLAASDTVDADAPSSLPATLPERPARLFSEPRALRVIAMTRDGPPTWFALGSVEHVIRHTWGPQRVETGWWRGPDNRRDYYRVESDLGEQFWIYQEANHGTWYLHGLFV